MLNSGEGVCSTPFTVVKLILRTFNSGNSCGVSTVALKFEYKLTGRRSILILLCYNIYCYFKGYITVILSRESDIYCRNRSDIHLCISIQSEVNIAFVEASRVFYEDSVCIGYIKVGCTVSARIRRQSLYHNGFFADSRPVIIY